MVEYFTDIYLFTVFHIIAVTIIWQGNCRLVFLYVVTEDSTVKYQGNLLLEQENKTVPTNPRLGNYLISGVDDLAWNTKLR